MPSDRPDRAAKNGLWCNSWRLAPVHLCHAFFYWCLHTWSYPHLFKSLSAGPGPDMIISSCLCLCLPDPLPLVTTSTPATGQCLLSFRVPFDWSLQLRVTRKLQDIINNSLPETFTVNPRVVQANCLHSSVGKMAICADFITELANRAVRFHRADVYRPPELPLLRFRKLSSPEGSHSPTLATFPKRRRPNTP